MTGSNPEGEPDSVEEAGGKDQNIHATLTLNMPVKILFHVHYPPTRTREGG